MTIAAGLRRLLADERGAAVIETAIVAPVLLVLALGAFDVSSLVARQNELQNAASESETIALTFAAGGTTDVTSVKNILVSSTGLRPDQVSVANLFRCGTNTTLESSAANCAPGDIVSTYLDIRLHDPYNPLWTTFGVGHTINLTVARRVQIA